MKGFDTYEEVLERIDDRGHEYRILGYASTGVPIVAIEVGGEKEPPILVTAGSHAPEHAGVAAAVELADRLETEHQVYIVPTRDPIGLNGYDHALETVLDTPVELNSFGDIDTIFRSEADVTFDQDGVTLGLIGDVGFANARPADGNPSYIRLLERLKELSATEPSVLRPFAGRRIYTPAGAPDTEGAGRFERAFTHIVSHDGELLHLNRFFDRSWAPIETWCLRQFMADISPGLTFDLHESSRQDDRYHISLRSPRQRQASSGRRRSVKP